MKKVLILAYYWPPSGGACVQRWLKLSKYLTLKGIEVHVVTVNPDSASYMQRDQSLCKDVNASINIHRTRSIEPIKLYAKLVGKSKVPVAGFSNVDNENWKQKTVNFIRSNFFIPDPRRGWNNFAYQKALKVIKEHEIKYVITTSPPQSTQLIGLRLKQTLKSSIKWIADFRDPWTDIYYYKVLQHSFLSNRINEGYERKVLEQSDVIFTVCEHFKSSFLSKTDAIPESKIVIITNGFDSENFQVENKIEDKENTNFIISYTGSISDSYRPEVFFKALGRLVKNYPDVSIQFRLIGVASEKMKSFILDQIGSSALFIPMVPHAKAIDYMLTSNILLLITPDEEGATPTPSKVFEYLASKKRIISIGKGDAAKFISDCDAGRAFDRDEEEEVFLYLESALKDFLDKKAFVVDTKKLFKYSREYQANQVIENCIKLNSGLKN